MMASVDSEESRESINPLGNVLGAVMEGFTRIASSDEDSQPRRRRRRSSVSCKDLRLDNTFEETKEGAEALRNTMATNLRRVIGPETMEMIHLGFAQGGGYVKPLIDRLPLHKAIKQSAIVMRVNGVGFSARMCLTKDRLCIARGGDPRTMTDAIPLVEIRKVSSFKGGRWIVETKEDGINNGLSYDFLSLYDKGISAVDGESTSAWMIAIEIQRRICVNEADRLLPKARAWARGVMKNPITLGVISFVVFANAFSVVCDAEYRPMYRKENRDLQSTFYSLDTLFTTFFVCELALNLFGHWFLDFFRSPWHVVDLLLVLISTVSWVSAFFGGGQLRAVRIIRVLRVFGFIRRLRRIMKSLFYSLAPVLQAFLFTLLIMSLFALAGVYSFGDRENKDFAFFGAAMFTNFKLMAFLVWHSDRFPVIAPPDYKLDHMVLIYLVSLTIVVIWIMLNIVGAALLHNYVANIRRDEQLFRIKKLNRAQLESEDALSIDPLLSKMISLFDTKEQLSLGLKRMFFVLDRDESGYIGYIELRDGLKKLNCEPRVDLHPEDFDVITGGGALLNDKGELSVEQFEVMMTTQLRTNVQRYMRAVMDVNSIADRETLVQLQVVRFMAVLLPCETEVLKKSVKLQGLSSRLDKLVKFVACMGKGGAGGGGERPQTGSQLELELSSKLQEMARVLRDAASHGTGVVLPQSDTTSVGNDMVGGNFHVSTGSLPQLSESDVMSGTSSVPNTSFSMDPGAFRFALRAKHMPDHFEASFKSVEPSFKSLKSIEGSFKSCVESEASRETNGAAESDCVDFQDFRESSPDHTGTLSVKVGSDGQNWGSCGVGSEEGAKFQQAQAAVLAEPLGGTQGRLDKMKLDSMVVASVSTDGNKRGEVARLKSPRLNASAKMDWLADRQEVLAENAKLRAQNAALQRLLMKSADQLEEVAQSRIVGLNQIAQEPIQLAVAGPAANTDEARDAERKASLLAEAAMIANMQSPTELGLPDLDSPPDDQCHGDAFELGCHDWRNLFQSKPHDQHDQAQGEGGDTGEECTETGAGAGARSGEV